MPCFHPRKGFQIGITENGKPKFTIQPWTVNYVEKTSEGWKGFDCPAPSPRVFVGDEFSSGMVTRFLPIPCGNCLGCRLDYAKTWSARLQHEFQMHDPEECWFLTLTYNNEALMETFVDPKQQIDRLRIGADSLGEAVYYSNLDARDMTLFWKRVRKNWPDCHIMYYQAGEYGEERGRCHFHAIAFGLPLDKTKLVYNGTNDLGDITWRSTELEKLWHSTLDPSFNLGNVIVGKVTAQSCAYVARYTLKKAKEMWEHDFSNRVRPFVRMSTKPAIGLSYIQAHPEIFDVSQFYIPTRDGSFMCSHPRYYLKKLADVDPERCEQLKADRAFAGKLSYENMLKNEKPYLEQLLDKEMTILQKTARIRKRR